MNSVFEFFRRFAEVFVWWTVIQPWEGAIRTRFGHYVKPLSSGVHLRIPYADSVYRQSIRLRFCMMGTQTISTMDGKTITLAASLGYRIASVFKLYNTIHHGEETIRQLAMSEIARFIQCHPLAECKPETIENAVSRNICFDQYGITSDGIRLIDFAVVRTYRIINDQRWGIGDVLDTTQRDTTAMGIPRSN